ncbi:MAG: sugar ABC transporter substrate-binding protein [Lachnospiraceae bacterium]|nr:sugar ABC transporter substrate-binding protein [Lachnospiraceae bacterium]
MKKTMGMVVSLGLAASMGIGCYAAENDKSLTVGLALSGITSNAIFIDMTKEIQTKCDEAGYKLMTADIQDGTGTIVTALENFINGGCDVIILQNSAEEAYGDLLQDALDKGITIGSYDYVSEYAQYAIYASNEDLGYQIGQQCGNWVNEHEGSKKVAICGYSSLDFLVTREQGIEKGFMETCPDGEIVSVQDAGYAEDGVVVGENFLQVCPDIQAVMGINDGGTLGVYEAFKAAGKSLEKDGIGIFGCDASADGLNAVKEGDMFICTMDLDLVNEVSTLYDRCVETALTGEVDESVAEEVYPIIPVYLADLTD